MVVINFRLFNAKEVVNCHVVITQDEGNQSESFFVSSCFFLSFFIWVSNQMLVEKAETHQLKLLHLIFRIRTNC
jgi:hypothetical protein